jgi:hypothetical protein
MIDSGRRRMEATLQLAALGRCREGAEPSSSINVEVAFYWHGPIDLKAVRVRALVLKVSSEAFIFCELDDFVGVPARRLFKRQRDSGPN